MNTSDEAIADLAFEYIERRRAKINFKQMRDGYVSRCEKEETFDAETGGFLPFDAETRGFLPCLYDLDFRESEGDSAMCEACQQALVYDHEYKIAMKLTTNALRKLERRVEARLSGE